MTKAEDWEETLEDLDRRRQHAWAMGGPERLAKHRDKGKLDARARVERLLDPGTGPVKYTLEYPSELPTAPDDFLRPEVIRDVVSHAEAAGFSAVALSEHPAPSLKWRRNGGHNTLDPIAPLSFMAGVTTRIS